MLSDKTKRWQHQMARFCRDGNPIALPVDSEFRLGQYRRLVFNVVKGTLTQAYPIAAKHLGEDNWHSLVEAFFTHHSCQHPQVWRMPRELIDFVRDTQYAPQIPMPFLIDLLRMEWLEIEVHSMPDQEIPAHIEIKDILDSPLVINPHHVIERFDYPVHRADQLTPETPRGNWFLLIFRNEKSGKVHFLHIQPLYAAVLSSLFENPEATPREVLNAIYHAQGQSIPGNIPMALAELLEALAKREFVLGERIN